VIAAFAAILVVAVGVPTFALGADRVDNLLGGAGSGGGSTDSGSGATSSGGSVSDKAGVPPDNYVPPLHGTDPHGQGSIATVDLTPEAANPVGSDPSTSGEEVVVGDSNGTQSGGQYHGRVTLLWLFGNPVIDVSSDQSNGHADGPFQPINDGLQQLCDGSGGQLCLKLLDMHSDSTATGSNNSFELLGAHLGGDQGILLDVGTSNGNINQSGDCQTAHGDSSVANLDIQGGSVAQVGQGDSTSTACSGGSKTTDQHSTVLGLGGNEVLPGCGPDGPANTSLIDADGLLQVLCNASDTTSGQTSDPYGVREALAVFALVNDGIPGGALLRVTAGSAESHAVAPGPTSTENPPTTGGGTKGAGGKGGNGGNGGNNGGNGNGAGNGGGGGAANEAAAGNGSLAFTGADLLVLGLIGGALILGGLALTTLAGRSHRQTV
jgi:hypothetical protein